jgi:hypothetical protein
MSDAKVMLFLEKKGFSQFFLQKRCFFNNFFSLPLSHQLKIKNKYGC